MAECPLLRLVAPYEAKALLICTFIALQRYNRHAMKILVTTIPFSGMKIDAHISKDSLNARLKGGSKDTVVSFESDPLVDITLSRTHGGVLVKGIASGRCKQDCSSCGDLVPHEAVAQIDWVLQNASDRAAPNDEIDDPGVIFYEGEHVDLEEPIQEALILSLSPFWHPPRDTQERCSYCTKDCSAHRWGDQEPTSSDTSKGSPKTSSFGSLLKGALKGSSNS
jgi:uncharacterized metal-binding protein YceD (DUF177 family)